MLPLPSPSLQAEIDSGTTNLEKTSVPAFVNIYRHLTTRILEYDGSTQARNKGYEETGIVEELQRISVRASRSAVLLRSLREIFSQNSRDNDLPSHLRELCHVISTYLSVIADNPENTDNDVEELMAEELVEFRQNLPTITQALSRYLMDLEDTTIKMLELLVDTPPDTPQPQTTTRTRKTSSRIPSSRTTTARSYKPTSVPTTTRSSASLLTTHQQTQSQLQSDTFSKTLTSLSSTLHTLLTTQTQLLTSQLRHAELHTHSTVSRYTTSHATFLNTVAQGLSLKTQILTLHREKEAYAERGIREALRARYQELEREEQALGERETRLRLLLGEFEEAGGRKRGGGAGEGGMEVFERLGEGYADAEREIEVVRRDVERLEAEIEGGRRGSGRVGGGRR